MLLVSEYTVSVSSTPCAMMPCRTAFFPPHSPSVLLSRFIGIKMTEALLHDACAGCKSKMFRNITGISGNYFRITISHFMVEHSSTYIQCETRVRELLRVACLTDGSSERQSTAKRDTWKRETRSKSEGFVPGVSSVNFPLSVPSEQGNTDNPDGISGIHDQHDLQDGLGSLSSRSSVSARCQIEAHVTVLSELLHLPWVQLERLLDITGATHFSSVSPSSQISFTNTFGIRRDEKSANMFSRPAFCKTTPRLFHFDDFELGLRSDSLITLSIAEEVLIYLCQFKPNTVKTYLQLNICDCTLKECKVLCQYYCIPDAEVYVLERMGLVNKALLLQLDSYFVHFKDDPSYYPAAVFKTFADKMIAQTVGLCFRSLPDSWKVVVRALLRHLNEDQSRSIQPTDLPSGNTHATSNPATFYHRSSARRTSEIHAYAVIHVLIAQSLNDLLLFTALFDFHVRGAILDTRFPLCSTLSAIKNSTNALDAQMIRTKTLTLSAAKSRTNSLTRGIPSTRVKLKFPLNFTTGDKFRAAINKL